MSFQQEMSARNFAEINARFGLGDTECTVTEHPQIKVNFGESLRVGSDDSSAFDLPQSVIKDSDHFAQLAEVTPNLLASEADPKPAPLPRLSAAEHPQDLGAAEISDWLARAEEGLEAFTADEQMRLRNALAAKVIGDVTLVSSLIKVVDRALFPMPIKLFSVDTLTIGDGGRLELGGDYPIMLNVRELIIEGVGCLHGQTQLMLFAHSTTIKGQDERSMATLANGLAANPSLNFVPSDWPVAATGNPGDAGIQPPKGANGKNSYNSTNCTHECPVQPEGGSTGGKGGTGKTGTNGQPGKNFTGVLPLNLGPINGTVTVNYGGGNGQTGGTGGQGGSGGAGGLAGDAPAGCTVKSAGAQGRAGDGGQGGNGGGGGSAPSGRITYTGQATVHVAYNNANGGSVGAGGHPGATGTPAGDTGPAGATAGANVASGTLTLPPT